MPAAQLAGYRGRFLMLLDSADIRKSAAALNRGVSGIFLNSEAPERLVRAIRQIASDEIWIDQKVIHLLAHELTDRYPGMGTRIAGKILDQRERRVLDGVIAGLSNRGIGTAMGLSVGSVKNVLQQLFSKAGVRKRGQLVRMAMENSAGNRRGPALAPNCPGLAAAIDSTDPA